MGNNKEKSDDALKDYRPPWMDEDWVNDPKTTVFELPDEQVTEKAEFIQFELFDWDAES